MQLLDIILYGPEGQARTVSFELGKVNIITGDSKTGKTAIIDIVDYCLGSGDFKVAEGVVREYVYWYAVRCQLNQGQQILIARPNPTKYDRSGSDVFFLQADSLNIPSFDELVVNINADTLLLKLANIIGIEEYVHQPESLSRPDTPITFKHSRFYCFQPQTAIDQRDFLFYNQKKEFWVEQAMKDTLPYFLGAVASENIILERQLADKKRNLNRLGRELKESHTIVDKTLAQVFDLINEAKQVGLLTIDVAVKDRDEGLTVLQSLAQQEIVQDAQNIENELLLLLQTQIQGLVQEREPIISNIKAAEDYEKDSRGYESETEQQVLRLESINLFSKTSGINDTRCPLCESTLEVRIPTIDKINESLQNLQGNLNITKRDIPRLKAYIEDLKNKKSDINSRIRDIERSISNIYTEREEAQKLKDLNVRKGKVLGRISLYLESKAEVNDFSDLQRKISNLRAEVEVLEKALSTEEVEDKLDGILDQLSVQMTSWAQELQLEFKDRTIKFDIKKLTLFIISTDKKIRFDQTGSGENWVAYHLLIHFALHRYFIINNRPVPHFLILDQLSQAYFPPEKDIDETGEIQQSEDDLAIKRMFDFVFNRTEELNGKMQTIIIDHAKLKDEKFLSAISEEWRRGTKLVPVDWIKEVSG